MIHAWCMYDWAISGFHTTVMAAILPIFFRNVAAATLPSTQHHLATSIWGYTAAIAMLFVAVLSLLLGPLADHAHTKKRFLAFFSGIGVLFTACLALTGTGDWLWVSLFFIAANIGSAGSEVFYDALLPHISPPGEIDRISARGYTMGYLGGGILLAVNIGMMMMLPRTPIASVGEGVPLLGMKLSFLSVALWWGLFSFPLFRRVPEPVGIRTGLSDINPMTVSIRRLSSTFRELRAYRQLFLFILAYWFYSDGIGTIMKMATAFGDEIGIGIPDLVGALMLTQVVGVPMTFAFGRLSDRIGAKKCILIGLGVYTLVCIGAFFMVTALHFWMLALFVGIVQGGTQALSRSLYGSMIPKEKSAEFFSFYAISGKFAGIMGPALFGFASQLSGTSRLGILSLILFFGIGGLLLCKIDAQSNDGRPL